MSRSARLGPAVAALLALALAGTACDGGVRGTPGGSGVRDPYFPKAGNGGYDVIQGWAATHRYGTASTADFTAYVEKKAPGKDFSEIWKDWLYGNGKPDHP